MEAQLKELIDKIKTEGVAEAEEKAKQILQEAERQAAGIISGAKKEAERTASAAGKEAERTEQAGKEALKQAGRDLVLNLKGSVTKLFESIVNREIKAALTEDALQKILIELIHAWQKEKKSDIEILLSAQDYKKVKDGMLEKLAAEMKKGVEFKPLPEIQAGFRIGEKDGAVFYDFTDKGITEHLAQYLNPKLADCLK